VLSEKKGFVDSGGCEAIIIEIYHVDFHDGASEGKTTKLLVAHASSDTASSTWAKSSMRSTALARSFAGALQF